MTPMRSGPFTLGSGSAWPISTRSIDSATSTSARAATPRARRCASASLSVTPAGKTPSGGSCAATAARANPIWPCGSTNSAPRPCAASSGSTRRRPPAGSTSGSAAGSRCSASASRNNLALADPANQWHVRGRLESVGPPAFERQLAQEFVTNFVPTPGHAYTASITPTGAADQPGEGVYELAVLLDLRRPNGTRLPARGFQDGIQLDFFS